MVRLVMAMTLTSTSLAAGSLLKHMVMVLRAIRKKLVSDTDFPCGRVTVGMNARNAAKIKHSGKLRANGSDLEVEHK